MPYKRMMGSDNPGLFVFLLDCSGSMTLPWPGDSASAGMVKAEFVANVLNRTVRELGAVCLSKPRFDVAMIGYDSSMGAKSLWGGKLAGRDAVSIVEVVESPIGTWEKEEQKADPEVGVVIVKRKIDYWLKPTTGGSTPMGTGLAKARAVIEGWLASDERHKNAFPPVVIHVTDGVPDPSERTKALAEAEKIKAIQTEDGNVLLFTVHLPEGKGQSVMFPVSESDLPTGDDSAQLLYTMSSVLPDERMGDALESGLAVRPGSRLMVMNADALAAMQMIQFGSTGSAGGMKSATTPR